MILYETLFIIKPDPMEDQIQEVIDRLTSRIEGVGGKPAVIDHWGNRELAYPIRYRGERLYRGYYVLLTYAGDGATVEEVERNIKIMDITFRYLTVKQDENFDADSIGEVEIIKRERKSRPRPEGETPSRDEDKPDSAAEEGEAKPADATQAEGSEAEGSEQASGTEADDAATDAVADDAPAEADQVDDAPAEADQGRRHIGRQ